MALNSVTNYRGHMNTSFRFVRNSAFIGLASYMISGCLTPPKTLEEDFGVSVRQMVKSQIYDPVVAAEPGDLPPEILDGIAASESLKGYRERSVHEDEEDEDLTLILR